MTPRDAKTEKINSRTLATVAVASAVAIFCLMSTKALLSQAAYQRRVVNAKHATVNQLKANIVAVNNLSTQYKVFVKANPNALGGSVSGGGPSDGDNAKLVLDALPSKYDFPALATSMEKIVKDDHLGTANITGVDNEGSQVLAPSATPAPITMNLTIDGTGNYTVVQTLLNDLQRSIRPFNINNLSLSGNQSNLQVTLGISTYYQPSKTVNITQKVVK